MTRFIFLFAVVALLAQAQAPSRGASPAAQYHTGAQAFIDGDNARALTAVEAGLAAAPGDARLQALRDLIEQQQDEQDNQDGGQQDPQADNQEQGDQGNEGDQGEDGNRPPPNPGEQDGPEPEADQTGTQPPRDPASGDTPPPPSLGEPDKMTAAQADRILDAVGGEERLLLREIRRAPAQRRRSDKDW